MPRISELTWTGSEHDVGADIPLRALGPARGFDEGKGEAMGQDIASSLSVYKPRSVIVSASVIQHCHAQARCTYAQYQY
jgi:hypothetical protein